MSKYSLFGITLLTLAMFLILSERNVMSKEAKSSNLKIREVLPLDAIPSIKNPQFVSAGKAQIHPNEPVIGLSINGYNRAYSVYLLNSHEIVNDVIGSKPVAVTW